MANYSDIKGYTVQTLSEDPVTSTPTSGVWASGANLNTGRYLTTGCAYGYARGSTLALCVGGRTPPENYQSTNEKYDGTSWTELGDLSTRGRDQLSGFGTTTSAIAAGGYAGNDPPRRECESWDGSSWTEVGDLNSQTYASGAAGVSNTSGLVFSGAPTPSDPNAVKTESWDGSSWTEVGDLNSGAPGPAGCGIQTAALSINGESDEGVESWNGSAWTEIADPNNTDRRGAVAAGSYTDAVVYGGGNPSRITKTETYNGTAWTEVADMGTASQYSGGGGQSNGFAINYGGATPSNPNNSAATEEFQIAPITAAIKSQGQLFYNSTSNVFKETVSDVPGAAWASITASNTPRFGLGGAGTQTEALIFSGAGGSPTANRPQTEHWNGSSWTELNDLNLGRYHSAKTSFGTVYTAALAATGYTYVSPAQNIANVESWDGTSWTEVNDVNSARRGAGAGGTSTSGIIGGGYTTTITNLAETWNGSSWTEVSELNTGREDTGGVGTSNSDMQMHGGYTGSQSGATEQWNGSSWTEVNDMNTARSGAAGSGTPSLAIAVGGEPGNSAKTEFWNGSSWTEVGDIGTARTKAGSSATSALASIFVAGSAPPFSAAAEEWTVNLANKTITSS